jgi:CDP-glucose 4,6-dehydratase
MGKDYSSAMDLPLGQRLRELPGPLMITGHSGFKGTWMTLILEQLNIKVVGYSLVAEKDSLFDRTKRIGSIPEKFEDIRDCATLESFIDLHKPSAIIHMAAQPLVLESYKSPRETMDVNVMGTANVLDIAFKKEFIKAIIVVTTDKVYKNDNSGKAFIESDALEGKDPYSASKVGAEAAVAAWQHISGVLGGPTVISVRAGNVIGGGDWGENRLIPDIIKGYIQNKEILIRNPDSTRPWQHVLDPLTGYIMALEYALTGFKPLTFNFGPDEKSLTSLELAKIGNKILNFNFDVSSVKAPGNLEAGILELNPGLAKEVLGWQPSFSQEDAICITFQWWEQVLSNQLTPYQACINDITETLSLLENRI